MVHSNVRAVPERLLNATQTFICAKAKAGTSPFTEGYHPTTQEALQELHSFVFHYFCFSDLVDQQLSIY